MAKKQHSPAKREAKAAHTKTAEDDMPVPVPVLAPTPPASAPPRKAHGKAAAGAASGVTPARRRRTLVPTVPLPTAERSRQYCDCANRALRFCFVSISFALSLSLLFTQVKIVVSTSRILLLSRPFPSHLFHQPRRSAHQNKVECGMDDTETVKLSCDGETAVHARI